MHSQPQSLFPPQITTIINYIEYLTTPPTNTHSHTLQLPHKSHSSNSNDNIHELKSSELLKKCRYQSRRKLFINQMQHNMEKIFKLKINSHSNINKPIIERCFGSKEKVKRLKLIVLVQNLLSMVDMIEGQNNDTQFQQYFTILRDKIYRLQSMYAQNPKNSKSIDYGIEARAMNLSSYAYTHKCKESEELTRPSSTHPSSIHYDYRGKIKYDSLHKQKNQRFKSMLRCQTAKMMDRHTLHYELIDDNLSSAVLNARKPGTKNTMDVQNIKSSTQIQSRQSKKQQREEDNTEYEKNSENGKEERKQNIFKYKKVDKQAKNQEFYKKHKNQANSLHNAWKKNEKIVINKEKHKRVASNININNTSKKAYDTLVHKINKSNGTIANILNKSVSININKDMPYNHQKLSQKKIKPFDPLNKSPKNSKMENKSNVSIFRKTKNKMRKVKRTRNNLKASQFFLQQKSQAKFSAKATSRNNNISSESTNQKLPSALKKFYINYPNIAALESQQSSRNHYKLTICSEMKIKDEDELEAQNSLKKSSFFSVQCQSEKNHIVKKKGRRNASFRPKGWNQFYRINKYALKMKELQELMNQHAQYKQKVGTKNGGSNEQSKYVTLQNCQESVFFTHQHRLKQIQNAKIQRYLSSKMRVTPNYLTLIDSESNHKKQYILELERKFTFQSDANVMQAKFKTQHLQSQKLIGQKALTSNIISE